MRTSLAVLVLLASCAGSPPSSPSPDSPPPPPPAEFRIEDGALVLPGPVTFVAGQAVPGSDSDAALRHVVAFLAEKPSITLLRVEVHGDESGDGAQALTEARALGVVVRLQELGAAGERLLPVGFGATKPVADNQTPASRAQNRRVEFRPAALRGKPIGGLPVDGGGRIATPRK
jgi:OOP family OmpA-OmpF porin